MRDVGWEINRAFFALRTDNQAVHWQMARAGCGVGIIQRAIGHTDSGVVQLLPEQPLPAFPIWLTAHESLRHTSRVASEADPKLVE